MVRYLIPTMHWDRDEEGKGTLGEINICHRSDRMDIRVLDKSIPAVK